jgi:hypothetical protein
MVTSLGASEKVAFPLVEFKYGDPAAPSYKRFAQYTIDAYYGIDLYTAMPELDIKMPEISAMLSDKTLLIGAPLKAGSGFFDSISSGIPFSEVTVTLYERIIGTQGEADITLKHYIGLVTKVSRNYQRPDWVQLEVASFKSRLMIPLGLPANVQCVWTLGGRGCFISVPQETGTMTVIAGKIVTITGLSGRADRFWHRGYVVKNGCRILIRDWVNGTSFTLTKEPPADWTGASVQVFAGCDKTIQTCRARFSNEEHFGGFGYAIPAYSPNYELV